MFFIAGGNIFQMIISGLLGLATLVDVNQPFVIIDWPGLLLILDPLNVDPLGDGYQIRQILIALGSGGTYRVRIGGQPPEVWLYSGLSYRWNLCYSW
jgi:cell division protein FtsW (lipid II flippase)